MEGPILSVSDLMEICGLNVERRRFARQQMFLRVYAIWPDPQTKQPMMIATILSDLSKTGLCIFSETGRLLKGLSVLIVSNDSTCVPFQVVGRVVSVDAAMNGKDRVGIEFAPNAVEFNRHTARDWNTFVENMNSPKNE